MAINWAKLKGDEPGKSFEKLAIDYLKNNFDGNWTQTNQTRDGNRDAFSIVFFNKESWAEAKFTKHHRISRYRLDATIVSAIIHNNKVIEIIFITNSQIDNATQIDIEKALRNAIGESFNTVHFKTKLDIEFWLYNNPNKYTDYFDDNIETIKELQFDKSIITAPASFFKQVRQSIHFREPLRELYVGDTYEITFSLFSPNKKENSVIKLDTDLINLSQSSIDIQEGNNRICIKGECIKAGLVPQYFISVDDVKIDTYGRPLIKESEIKLQIKSQSDIEKVILKSFKDFKDSSNSVIHIIKGNGGIGKSTLIDNLLKSDCFQSMDIIYQSASKDNIDSGILLVNIILSVLFHHSVPSLIDVEYLEKLEEKLFVSSFLKDLVRAKNNIEKQKNDETIEDFNLKISEYTDSKELFPKFIELNRKVIILDDLHKLDSLSRVFLFNFLSDIYTSKINCFIILCARNTFWQTSEYFNFVELHKVEKHHYVFTNEDLWQNIELHGYIVEKKFISILLSRVQLDIFFASSLIKFLKRNDNFFKNSNLESRHAVINSFIAEDGHIKSILEIFRELSEQEKEIIKIVYFSLSGIDKSHIKPELIYLFENLELSGHIILNNDFKYVPFHDIYQDVFKEAYLPLSTITAGKYLNCLPTEHESRRDYLLFSDHMSADQQSLFLQSIRNLISNHKFFISLYILEPLFLNSSAWDKDINIKNKCRLGEVFYYNLQYYYAYSVANCDKNRGGKEEFHRLYKEIENIINPEIKYIFLKTLAELINSSFEHLALSEIKEYSDKLKKTILDIEKEGYIKEGKGQYEPAYLLSLEIEILTCLMLDQTDEANHKNAELEQLCIAANDFNKLAINKIRYSRSIYHSDINLAYKNINDAVTDLINIKSNEIKWILLGKFELYFIQIQKKIKNDIKDLKESHEKLKENYFNDYKKGCLVIAACYIFFGMQEQAYHYLYRNYFDKRQMRPRFKAIRLSLLAIYKYIFENNSSLALEYLKEQYNIFDNLGNSYKEIVSHNIKIISNSSLIKKVTFYSNDNKFSDDSLFIDPRIW